MNILIISNNPERASFRQRIGIYFDRLHENGIDCEVARLPGGIPARFKLLKKAKEFEVVFIHKKCFNFWDAILLRRYGKKIIYDFDDAVMYSPKRPGKDRSSHFRLFKRTAKIADMIIAGNSYLGEHARQFNQNVTILPTGLDTKSYDIKTSSKNDGKVRLVWIGSQSTLRYLADVRPALEEIGMRFDNVILRIICDSFPDIRHIEVEKCLWSGQTQAMDLATSDIGLSPLPDNRFTRGKCGFKILQYQAAGLPVIASPVGVNAEFVRNGFTGYHASNPEQWIESISRLIKDPVLRKQMGNEARKDVQKFDSVLIGNKLCELIGEAIKKRV